MALLAHGLAQARRQAARVHNPVIATRVSRLTLFPKRNVQLNRPLAALAAKRITVKEGLMIVIARPWKAGDGKLKAELSERVRRGSLFLLLRRVSADSRERTPHRMLVVALGLDRMARRAGRVSHVANAWTCIPIGYADRQRELSGFGAEPGEGGSA